MVRALISLVLHVLANAIGLIVAAWILDDMTLDGAAMLVAVLIFTGIEILALPLLRKMAMKHVEPLQGGVALVATLVSLILTAIISDGLHIHGGTTWILATLIVWLAALIAAIILPAIFLKNKVEERRS